jgi:formate-dependent nitrite reductase cytochrome c552 subunit
VGGTTPEKNVAGSAFGNPNGYTPDQDLSKFLTVFTTVPTEAEMMTYVNSGGAKPKFLPNGADFSMRHTYYNEWLINKVPSEYGGSHGHADPLNPAVKTYNTAFNGKCVGCHSGIGFINRIESKAPNGALVATDVPTIAELTALGSDGQPVEPGISCAVCHDGHVGYTKDGKGYDSRRKWGDGKDVECTDCHNWQFEVLEQPVQFETSGTTKLVRPALNQHVRHPALEMYSGGQGGLTGNGGMWGVAPMGKFMPTATCESCHMPRTHKEGMPANDDGSTEATRMSHRFHITKPGDAERWKLRKGGDSCKIEGCHTQSAEDYTRADFQSWIESVQNGTMSAANETTKSLGLVSAQVGMTGSWQDFFTAQPAGVTAPTATEWKMLQKAAQNAEFVISDGSKGVHQPQYAGLGLDVASKWARGYRAQISAAMATRIDGFDGVKITGTLAGNDGKAIVGARVKLEKSTDGGATWATVQTRTLSNTSFAFIQSGLAGDTVFRCSYSPDTGVEYRSADMLLSVPVTSMITLPAEAATQWVDSNVLVTLVPSEPGAFTMYSLSGATVKPATLYLSPFAIAADGSTNVTFWSIGSQATELPKTQAVRIDKTVPTVSSDAVALYTDSASIHVAGTDVYSGPQYVETSLDSGAWVKSANPTATVSTAALGAHTLRARATNNLGHTGAIVSWNFNVKTGTALSKSPAASTVSLKRGSYWKFSAGLRASSGAPVAGKIVYLQRSGNGSTWSTVVSLRTSASGAVSRTAKFSTKGSSYWRWYSPADGSYFSATGARTRVTVR